MQGDIFSGLNDGILSRAEALADISKHQSSHSQMSTQLKHDVMYHHSMGGPPQRPIQVMHAPTANISDRIDRKQNNNVIQTLRIWSVCVSVCAHCSIAHVHAACGMSKGKIMRLKGMGKQKKIER